MSTAYEQTGRARQKQRTRDALVAAARDLVARGGRPPTVAEAAEAADGLPDDGLPLLPDAAVAAAAAHPEIQATSMLPPDVGQDPEVRLEAAVRGFLAMVVDTEPQQRTMLRLSLEAHQSEPSGKSGPRLPLRQGRAIGWFCEALEPLAGELGTDGVRRLAVAVRAVCGIESLVWLRDVAGMTQDEAVEQMVWSAVALLRRAVQQG